MHDKMLNKEKLLHQNQIPQPNVFKEDRVDNVYAYAMHQQMHENDTLQKSKFNFKDSDQMIAVKQPLQQITNKMRETIPQEKEAFAAAYAALKKDYANLITACRIYLEGHPSPRTLKGKTRKRLVNGTLAMAQKESAQLENAISQLKPYFESGEPLLWGNVLGLIRGVFFNLNEDVTLDNEGAGTSELLKLETTDMKTYHFKADEKLTTPIDALKEEYKDLQTPEEKKILKNILKLMDVNFVRKKDMFGNYTGMINLSPAAIDRLMTAPKGGCRPLILETLEGSKAADAREQVIAFIQELRTEGMTDLELHMENETTWDLFREILPRYWKLRTRLGVSLSAGIAVNQSLSQRNVATSRMATILGMPSLVVPTNKATLHEDGKEIQNGKGIIMSQAKGVSYAYLWHKRVKEDHQKLKYSPNAMRQLSCLRLFDTICGQCDRHANNFFVNYDFDKDTGAYIVTEIQGIDNDMSFGDLEYRHIQCRRTMRLLPFEDNDGYCSIPLLDKKMVASLRELTRDDLTYYLGDLLDSKYIDAMWDRMENILKTIDRTADEKKLPDGLAVLQDEEGWKSESVQRHFVSLNKGYLY